MWKLKLLTNYAVSWSVCGTDDLFQAASAWPPKWPAPTSYTSQRAAVTASFSLKVNGKVTAELN
jgi:hypothetical protein